MKVFAGRIPIHSKGEGEMMDLTEKVADFVAGAGAKNGIVTVFVSGSTAAVITMEYEPGLVKDFPEMLERVAPKSLCYAHEEMWHDGNGHSHVRASLLCPGITVPFIDGKLALGTWQQIVFIELDTRSRSREIILQVLGE